MDIKSLQKGLRYCNRVKGVRQTYHVFEAQDYYFVLSFARAKSRASGYFNVVDKAAVEYVQGSLGGTRGLTTRDVAIAGRRSRHAPSRLEALNILYVLVALGRASITRVGERRQLFFTLRKA